METHMKHEAVMHIDVHFIASERQSTRTPELVK